MKRQKINKKEAGVGPFFNNTTFMSHCSVRSVIRVHLMPIITTNFNQVYGYNVNQSLRLRYLSNLLL